MNFENLKTELKGGIFYIYVNREKKLNALNVQTLAEINDAVQHIYDNPEIMGAIITGTGPKAFVAGADISEIAALTTDNASAFAKVGHDIFFKIEQCRKPVLAAVNGFALGGGCELAMSCHIRVASENAKFGQPEVNLGVIPGYGGTQRLTQLIGRSKAMELMLTGDMIGAAEAKESGLVSHVVPQEQLIAKCEEILAKIFTKAPIAVGLVIDSVNKYYQTEKGFQAELDNFGACFATADFTEGVAAFLEKRKPAFQGA